ncbi:hypothetical protein HCN44_010784 [Aphidius gifuensis]|uniref:Uncharacterized protein n=1 Tax=Aphidius gifuensis TaxID=684658 RepID=A0A835CS75_APHGI|nr:hypothetical protein HCN44_010784 [Aphidius gifuensis]
MFEYTWFNDLLSSLDSQDVDKLKTECSKIDVTVKKGILKYLKTCNRNDRHIKKQMDPCLIQQIMIEKTLLLFGSRIKSLTLDSSYDSEILPVLRKNCENLRTIKLELKNYNKKNCYNVFKEMFKLKEIEILNYPRDAGSFKLLKNLPFGVKNLTLIPNDFGLLLSDKFSTIINDLSDRLTSLTIENCVIDKKVFKSIAHCCRLTRLSLEGCHLPENQSSISCLMGLEYVNLSRTINIKNCIFISMALYCTRIKCLKLNYLNSSQLSKCAIQQLSLIRNLEDFSVIGLTHFDNDFTCRLVNLKRLDCQGCDKINDACVKNILRKNYDIEHLNVIGTSVTKHIKNFTINHVKNRQTKMTLFVNDELFDKYFGFANPSPEKHGNVIIASKKL